MGDDAEYYIEQEEADARLAQAIESENLDRNRKPVICWTDLEDEEIWSWQPLARVTDVFSNLLELNQIGTECFLASGVPGDGDEEGWAHEAVYQAGSPDLNAKRTLLGWDFHVATDDAQATHEIIVLSRHDAPLLREDASRKKRLAKSLRDEILCEMLEAMASFIEAKPGETRYVFSREL